MNPTESAQVVAGGDFEDAGIRPNSKGTLEFALRPYRISQEKLREMHGAVLGMITKILGVTPRHCQYLMLWPPAYECMSVLVPNFLNIPFCDFGVGTIDGGLRSLTTYVVSRAYGCSYCSAHCAGMGTIWKGDSLFLEKNAAAMVHSPDPKIFSPKELAAINIGKKVGSVPSQVSAEDIKELASVFTEKEQEAVVNCAVLMGFLNRFMDTFGMTLEYDLLEMGAKKLAETGWVPGISYEPEADAELMAEDKIESAKAAERKANSGFFTFLRMLFGAKMADMAALKHIPTSERSISESCRQVAGFAPYYLFQMLHSNARSAFVWSFLHQINKGSEEVPVYLKQLMCYICATNAGNNILRAHFAFMAFRSGVPVRRLANLFKGDDDDVAEDASVGAKEVAAMALAEASSGTPSTMSPTLVGLLTRQYTPAGVVELVTTVSLALMYHNYTSVYVPTSYEPVIFDFVQEHGATLGFYSEFPCTEEQMEWSAIADDIRLSSGNE